MLASIFVPNPEIIASFLGNIETVIRRCVAVMPTHQEFIDKFCAAEPP